jgi:sporulation protein YtfJ
MSEHPIKSLMSTAMENLKEMIDVNTIIGDPVETPDGSVILTVSKVGFGFAAGGSEFSVDGKKQSSQGGQSQDQGQEQKLPFGGGSGGGVSITPIAFLIVSPSGIKMLHLNEGTHLVEKILDNAPQAVEKIQQMFNKNNNHNSSQNNQNYNQQGYYTQNQQPNQQGPSMGM